MWQQFLFLTLDFCKKKQFFERELIKQKRVPSVPNHKLRKNIHIAKICSVVQQITISQSDVIALICGDDDDDDVSF